MLISMRRGAVTLDALKPWPPAGKSVYIKAHLAGGLDRKAWVTTVFNFSAQTSANVTQVRRAC